MLVPAVSEFMSLQTHTISRDQGRIVGIVSQRDLHIDSLSLSPDAIVQARLRLPAVEAAHPR